MRRYLRFVVLVMMVFTLPERGMTQENISDYLILSDIGAYKFQGVSLFKDDPFVAYRKSSHAGILNAIGHFGYDHNDVTYETHYGSIALDLGVSVQVTQHSGSDSDKWLLHEVEDGYRDPDVLEGNWTQGARVRDIEGNLIFGVRGSGYTWLSGSRVVNIEYTDLSGTKPEPLEVIKAYLVKFPSSITLTDIEAKSKSHSEVWLKDEISRRLWLADKWVALIVADDPKLYDKLDDVVKHLKVFLNYKEKYFGISEEEKAAGITAKSEQKALNIYLQQKDTDSIKKKLTAYKTWWAAHKGDAINLQ